MVGWWGWWLSKSASDLLCFIYIYMVGFARPGAPILYPKNGAWTQIETCFFLQRHPLSKLLYGITLYVCIEIIIIHCRKSLQTRHYRGTTQGVEHCSGKNALDIPSSWWKPIICQEWDRKFGAIVLPKSWIISWWFPGYESQGCPYSL